MSIPADAKMDKCPHAFLTADSSWDPSTSDNEFDNEFWNLSSLKLLTFSQATSATGKSHSRMNKTENSQIFVVFCWWENQDSSRQRLRHTGQRLKKLRQWQNRDMKIHCGKNSAFQTNETKRFVKTLRHRQCGLWQISWRQLRLRPRHIETHWDKRDWDKLIETNHCCKMPHRNSAFLTWRLVAVSMGTPKGHQTSGTPNNLRIFCKTSLPPITQNNWFKFWNSTKISHENFCWGFPSALTVLDVTTCTNTNEKQLSQWMICLKWWTQQQKLCLLQDQNFLWTIKSCLQFCCTKHVAQHGKNMAHQWFPKKTTFMRMTFLHFTVPHKNQWRRQWNVKKSSSSMLFVVFSSLQSQHDAPCCGWLQFCFVGLAQMPQKQTSCRPRHLGEADNFWASQHKIVFAI